MGDDMNQWNLLPVYENEEDRQLARTLVILILASWGVYLFVICTALYYTDWKLIAVTLTGCVLLILPLVLLNRRQLHSSSLVVMLVAPGTVTIIATVGQGIRDLAVVAFPIVFIFAGLTLYAEKAVHKSSSKNSSASEKSTVDSIKQGEAYHANTD